MWGTPRIWAKTAFSNHEGVETMRIRTFLPWMTVLLAVVLQEGPALLAEDTPHRDYGIIKTDATRHTKLQSVDLRDVRWTDGFWADRFEQCRTVTLPRLWELLADPEEGHVLENFKIAAGLADGEAWGCYWHDAWAYKWLEAACYVQTMHPDEALDRRMDELIAVVAKAQQPDGYLATQTTLRGLVRFAFNHHHELYTMGHLITAACAHHRITGKTDFLEVAKRAADYIHATYDGGDPMLANCPVNPSIIMAGVELYRTTGDKKYLHLANIIINNRGRKRGEIARTKWGRKLGGIDLNQDRIALRKSSEVVGHAVFYTYLYAGATDVYMETGDRTLIEPLERLWLDLSEKKMQVTGGVCPVHKGLSAHTFKPGELTITNDEVHEAAAMPFDLPNATAYNETCGQVGNMMWNWRMLFVTGDARFADVMELNLYNSILSGVGVDGKGWSYTNPLRWHGAEHVLLSNDAHQRFDPGEKHICCPTNLLRTVAEMHGYAYSTSEEGIWFHHYGGNRLATQLLDGRRIELTQTTEYPWQGDIRITLDEVDSDRPFAVVLRIPGWARHAKLVVNGKAADQVLQPGSYVALNRVWHAGDVLQLVLPMPVEMLVGDTRIEQVRNQVAVKRGPIVYCLESVDLPERVRFEDIHIPRDAKWSNRHDPELLGGVTVLETEAVVAKTYDGSSGLYGRLSSAEPDRLKVQMIPYYAWNNRGEPKMSVWLPLW